MMKKLNRLPLATAIGSLMLTAGGAQAGTTSYNLLEAVNTNNRLFDMPMAGDNPANDAGLGDPSTGGSLPGGTAGSMNSRNPAINPLGWTGPVSTQPTYMGGLPATWYSKIGVGDSDEVSTTEMLGSSNAINGGTNVPSIPYLSTAGKAYQDWGIASGPTNWGHNADFGLFTLTSAADVTITLQSDNTGNGESSGLRPGFSVWSGWDTAGGTRHTVWLPNGAPALVGANPTNSNPPVFPGLSSMGWGLSTGNGGDRPDDNLGAFQGTAYNVTADGVATLTLTNLAAGDYTLVLGGICSRAGGVSSGTTAGFCSNGASFGYKVSFTTKAPAAAKFKLSVSTTANGAGVAGKVTSNTGGIDCGTICSADFDKDASVTLTAAPTGAASKFDKWGGDCSSSGTATTCSVKMDKAKSVTAGFVAAPPEQFTLNVTKSASGTITGAGINCGVGGSTCSTTVNKGTQIALTATPASSGFQFASWTGCTSSTPSCTVTVDGNKTVGATFSTVAPSTYTLSIQKPAGGTITGDKGGINCGDGGSTCSATITSGETVKLTAAQTTGFNFGGWGNDCSSSGTATTCSLTMSSAKTVSASFPQIPPADKFTLSVSNSGNGSVTSNPAGIDCGSTCSFAFDKNVSVALTAKPVDGYSFSGWGGACSGTDACTVTMDAAKNVSAAFVSTAPGQFALTVTRTGEGTVSSAPGGIACGDDCSENYDPDTSVTLTAAPADGYTFSGWGGACSGTDACTVTMSEARNVSASFTAAGASSYPLTVAKRGSGAVTSLPAGLDCGTDCTESYDTGTLVTLTATPAPGWRFKGWSGACDGAPTCTVSVDAAKTITATFSLPPRRDFDGDGHADLLWRDDKTGRDNLWLMLGSTLKASGSVTAKGKDWSVASVANFNGDSYADVLWMRNNGEVNIWLMNAGIVSSVEVLPDIGRKFNRARTADFNGDLKPDILWASTSTGEAVLWLMDGTTVQNTVTLPAALPGYALAEVQDFNGDGQPDVWWTNASTGENSLWLMAGTEVQSTVAPPTAGADWKLAGAGLFDHDAKADVLWTNRSTGQNQLWLMDGGTRSGVVDLPETGKHWFVAGIDYFKGNGTPDVLWRHRGNGKNRLWVMDGSTVKNKPQVTAFSKGWSTPKH